jgi:hypothetical protein
MNSFFSQCLDILKREDIKYKMKDAFEPVIELIMYEIRPYLYMGICMIIVMFLMLLTILGIVIFLLRNKL